MTVSQTKSRPTPNAADLRKWFGAAEAFVRSDRQCRHPLVGDLNKRLFSTIAVFGLLLCLCSFSPAEDFLRGDPGRLYSDLLRFTFSGGNYKQFIVASRTMSQCNLPPNIFCEFKTLSPDTMDDFTNKNQTAILLEDRFAADLNVSLITGDQTSAVFSSRENQAWKTFFNLYPDSQGITRFSQIGFNKEKTQALVCVEGKSDWRSGMGCIILFEWNSEAWLFVLAIPLWDCDTDETIAAWRALSRYS
jgi:hypothetical protein